jgi:HEPN domain-containing protein
VGNWTCTHRNPGRSKLLKELPLTLNKELMGKGAYLDKMYIPARYPNGFVSGSPADYFTDKEAREAISYAKDILVFVKSKIYK